MKLDFTAIEDVYLTDGSARYEILEVDISYSIGRAVPKARVKSLSRIPVSDTKLSIILKYSTSSQLTGSSGLVTKTLFTGVCKSTGWSRGWKEHSYVSDLDHWAASVLSDRTMFSRVFIPGSRAAMLHPITPELSMFSDLSGTTMSGLLLSVIRTIKGVGRRYEESIESIKNAMACNHGAASLGSLDILESILGVDHSYLNSLDNYVSVKATGGAELPYITDQNIEYTAKEYGKYLDGWMASNASTSSIFGLIAKIASDLMLMVTYDAEKVVLRPNVPGITTESTYTGNIGVGSIMLSSVDSKTVRAVWMPFPETVNKAQESVLQYTTLGMSITKGNEGGAMIVADVPVILQITGEGSSCPFLIGSNFTDTAPGRKTPLDKIETVKQQWEVGTFPVLVDCEEICQPEATETGSGAGVSDGEGILSPSKLAVAHCRLLSNQRNLAGTSAQITTPVTENIYLPGSYVNFYTPQLVETENQSIKKYTMLLESNTKSCGYLESTSISISKFRKAASVSYVISGVFTPPLDTVNIFFPLSKSPWYGTIQETSYGL